MSDSRRYLVTGGAGFIGSHLVAALLARGHDVVVIDDLSSGKRGNLDAAVADAGADAGSLHFIEGSLLDDDALSAAVDGVAAVMHQAAIPSVPRSFADPAATMRANAEGTTRLLEACRLSGVKRIAMASSSSIYGNTPTLPKQEDMEPSPMSPYALSKLTAEQAGGIFADIYGLEVFALRYFNVFGARQDPTSQYSAVIPKFITRMSAGETPVIYGDGLQSRDFSYIDNVVAANILAVTVDAEPGAFHVMNVACGDRFTLLDLVGSLNAILGTELEPEHNNPRPGDVRHSHASIDRAQEVLGYEPLVDFQEGLRRTVAAYVTAD